MANLIELAKENAAQVLSRAYEAAAAAGALPAGAVLPGSVEIPKDVANGDYAVGFFNFLDRTAGRCLMLSDVGLGGATGKGLEMIDLFSGETIRVDGLYCVEAPAHGSRMFRARVIDL